METHARKPASMAAHIIAASCAVVTAILGWVGISQTFSDMSYWPYTEWGTAALVTLAVLVLLVTFLVWRNALRIAVRLPLNSTLPRVVSIPVSDNDVVNVLREADFPCRSCRYNLRGINGLACPECGTPIKLMMVDAGSVPTVTGFGPTLVWLFFLISTSAVVLFSFLRSMPLGSGAFASVATGYTVYYYATVAIYALMVLGGAIRALLLLRRSDESKRRSWVRSTVVFCGIMTALHALLGAIGLLLL